MKRLLLALFLLLPGPSCTMARTLHVVAVGIAGYRYATPLRKAENDAIDVAALYRTHTSHVTLLTGSEATHRAILSALSQVFARAAKDDVVVVFFSGHGTREGLCAYDARGTSGIVTYRELAALVRKCPAANKQLFIDACYAGGLRASGRDSRTAEAAFGQKEGVLLFLSSRTGETSMENPYGRNGFFTQYLLRGLRGGADANGNRIVEAREIFDFVATRVRQATRERQHPVMWGQFRDDMHVLNWNPATP